MRVFVVLSLVALASACHSITRGIVDSSGSVSPAGKCTGPPVNAMCTREYVPVCGCDGKTYGNKCLATVAGIRLFTPGPCGGTDTCRQAPDPTLICATVYSPVCGCDGKTYGNACVANAAGIKETKNGACVVRDPPVKPPDVPTCRGNPNPDLTCPRTMAPVCGCDGVTYPNACLAEVVGIKQTTNGACTSTAPNTPPTDPTSDCKGPPISTGGMTCPVIARPVCGCDGKSYDNECIAGLAGIKRYSQGYCR